MHYFPAVIDPHYIALNCTRQFVIFFFITTFKHKEALSCVTGQLRIMSARGNSVAHFCTLMGLLGKEG